MGDLAGLRAMIVESDAEPGVWHLPACADAPSRSDTQTFFYADECDRCA